VGSVPVEWGVNAMRAAWGAIQFEGVYGNDGEHRMASDRIGSDFVCTPENGTRIVTGCLRVQR
jgi:hypothetical protein